ncbi:MAG: hypothetical protein COA42_20405 [Alteromonadaceae bacterium]|nr:MAG: hypothetical protein COA42_20405 [Alteromonadaceae bacterium]
MDLNKISVTKTGYKSPSPKHYSRYARISFNILTTSCFLLSTQNLYATEKNHVYQSTESFSFSEVSPIKQFADGLKGPTLDKGGLAITTSQVELGHKIHLSDKLGGISYAIFTRYDYFLEFTNDTATVFYADKNDLPLPQGLDYDIDLEAQHISAHGVKFGYYGSYSKNIDFQIHLSLLEAYDMLEGRLNGVLGGLGDNPSGDLELDYQYSEDKFFDREKSELSANGYSADIDIQWRPLDKFHVEFKGKDLFSKISWKNQDRTVGGATSNRVRFDDDGLLNVSPALSWQESERNIGQRLPMQLKLRGDYNFTGRDTLQLETFRYDTHYFSQIAYRHRFFKQIYLGLSYNFDLEATGFEINTPYFKLKISADDYDYEQAKALSFNLGFYLPL